MGLRFLTNNKKINPFFLLAVFCLSILLSAAIFKTDTASATKINDPCTFSIATPIVWEYGCDFSNPAYPYPIGIPIFCTAGNRWGQLNNACGSTQVCQNGFCAPKPTAVCANCFSPKVCLPNGTCVDRCSYGTSINAKVCLGSSDPQAYNICVYSGYRDSGNFDINKWEKRSCSSGKCATANGQVYCDNLPAGGTCYEAGTTRCNPADSSNKTTQTCSVNPNGGYGWYGDSAVCANGCESGKCKVSVNHPLTVSNSLSSSGYYVGSASQMTIFATDEDGVINISFNGENFPCSGSYCQHVFVTPPAQRRGVTSYTVVATSKTESASNETITKYFSTDSACPSRDCGPDLTKSMKKCDLTDYTSKKRFFACVESPAISGCYKWSEQSSTCPIDQTCQNNDCSTTALSCDYISTQLKCASDKKCDTSDPSQKLYFSCFKDNAGCWRTDLTKQSCLANQICKDNNCVTNNTPIEITALDIGAIPPYWVGFDYYIGLSALDPDGIVNLGLDKGTKYKDTLGQTSRTQSWIFKATNIGVYSFKATAVGKNPLDLSNNDTIYKYIDLAFSECGEGDQRCSLNSSGYYNPCVKVIIGNQTYWKWSDKTESCTDCAKKPDISRVICGNANSVTCPTNECTGKAVGEYVCDSNGDQNKTSICQRDNNGCLVKSSPGTCSGYPKFVCWKGSGVKDFCAPPAPICPANRCKIEGDIFCNDDIGKDLFQCQKDQQTGCLTEVGPGQCGGYPQNICQKSTDQNSKDVCVEKSTTPGGDNAVKTEAAPKITFMGLVPDPQEPYAPGDTITITVTGEDSNGMTMIKLWGDGMINDDAYSLSEKCSASPCSVTFKYTVPAKEGTYGVSARAIGMYVSTMKAQDLWWQKTQTITVKNKTTGGGDNAVKIDSVSFLNETADTLNKAQLPINKTVYMMVTAIDADNVLEIRFRLKDSSAPYALCNSLCVKQTTCARACPISSSKAGNVTYQIKASGVGLNNTVDTIEQDVAVTYVGPGITGVSTMEISEPSVQILSVDSTASKLDKTLAVASFGGIFSSNQQLAIVDSKAKAVLKWVIKILENGNQQKGEVKSATASIKSGSQVISSGLANLYYGENETGWVAEFLATTDSKWITKENSPWIIDLSVKGANKGDNLAASKSSSVDVALQDGATKKCDPGTYKKECSKNNRGAYWECVSNTGMDYDMPGATTWTLKETWCKDDEVCEQTRMDVSCVRAIFAIIDAYKGGETTIITDSGKIAGKRFTFKVWAFDPYGLSQIYLTSDDSTSFNQSGDLYDKGVAEAAEDFSVTERRPNVYKFFAGASGLDRKGKSILSAKASYLVSVDECSGEQIECVGESEPDKYYPCVRKTKYNAYYWAFGTEKKACESGKKCKDGQCTAGDNSPVTVSLYSAGSVRVGKTITLKATGQDNDGMKTLIILDGAGLKLREYWGTVNDGKIIKIEDYAFTPQTVGRYYFTAQAVGTIPVTKAEETTTSIIDIVANNCDMGQIQCAGTETYQGMQKYFTEYKKCEKTVMTYDITTKRYAGGYYDWSKDTAKCWCSKDANGDKCVNDPVAVAVVVSKQDGTIPNKYSIADEIKATITATDIDGIAGIISLGNTITDGGLQYCREGSAKCVQVVKLANNSKPGAHKFTTWATGYNPEKSAAEYSAPQTITVLVHECNYGARKVLAPNSSSSQCPYVSCRLYSEGYWAFAKSDEIDYKINSGSCNCKASTGATPIYTCDPIS